MRVCAGGGWHVQHWVLMRCRCDGRAGRRQVPDRDRQQRRLQLPCPGGTDDRAGGRGGGGRGGGGGGRHSLREPRERQHRVRYLSSGVLSCLLGHRCRTSVECQSAAYTLGEVKPSVKTIKCCMQTLRHPCYPDVTTMPPKLSRIECCASAPRCARSDCVSHSSCTWPVDTRSISAALEHRAISGKDRALIIAVERRASQLQQEDVNVHRPLRHLQVHPRARAVGLSCFLNLNSR